MTEIEAGPLQHDEVMQKHDEVLVRPATLWSRNDI